MAEIRGYILSIGINRFIDTSRFRPARSKKGAIVFKNLRVKFKLMLFVELFAVVFLIFGWYTFDTISLVKVNGEIYHSIIKSKGLITDLSTLGNKWKNPFSWPTA